MNNMFVYCPRVTRSQNRFDIFSERGADVVRRLSEQDGMPGYIYVQLDIHKDIQDLHKLCIEAVRVYSDMGWNPESGLLYSSPAAMLQHLNPKNLWRMPEEQVNQFIRSHPNSVAVFRVDMNTSLGIALVEIAANRIEWGSL